MVRRRRALLGVFSAVLVVIAGCSVSNLDYSGLACERAVDCPAPYVCAVAHGAQSATCVPADQGVPTTDGGACDVSNVLFSRDIQPIFDARCVTGCHDANQLRGNLLLAGPGTRSRLVDQPTSPDCNAERPGVLRVKGPSTPGGAGDPPNSMIWRKTSNDPSKCFDSMPFPNALISVAPCDFAKLEAWIRQGALDN
jgi:hypothetical protein